MMRALLEIARTSVTSFLMHPLQNVATAVCLLAALCPFLVGLGISRGLQAEAAASVRSGADFYVSGLQLGQRVPLSQLAQMQLAQISGVTSVVPRIVGSVELGRNRENAVLVGLPLDRLPASIDCVKGRLPQSSNGHELVLGVELAHRLKLDVGATIPPFYQNDRGEKLSQVVGLFRSDVSLWQSKLILTSLEAAAEIFDQPGMATDFLVYCRPGVQPFVRQQIQQGSWIPPDTRGTGIRFAVTSREDLQTILPKGILHREGIFNFHFTLIFVAAICAILVNSGSGYSQRRREIGILKATGWQTDEILFRSLVEGLLLSLTCACLAILLAYIWVRGLNGFWIASVFLAGVDVTPSFQIPFRLFPGPALITLLLSLACVISGTLYSSWRAATVVPLIAMR